MRMGTAATPRLGLVDLGWPVDTPYIAKRVADFADRGEHPQRLAQRVEHIFIARGGPPDLVQAARDFSRVPPGPQLGEPRRLLMFDRRIDSQRLVGLLVVAGIGIDANDLALAGVDLPRDLVGRPLDLSLLEPLLDGRDCTPELGHLVHPAAR